MKKTKLDPLAERPNLDWSKAVRGKYAERMKEGSNIVLIDSDLTESFPDSASVNRALRTLLAKKKQTKFTTARQKVAAKKTRAVA